MLLGAIVFMKWLKRRALERAVNLEVKRQRSPCGSVSAGYARPSLAVLLDGGVETSITHTPLLQSVTGMIQAMAAVMRLVVLHQALRSHRPSRPGIDRELHGPSR